MENLSNEELVRLQRAFQLDPAFFIKRMLGAGLWIKQKEIVDSVCKYRYTTVRACHDVGKTFTAARLVLWFLYTHPKSIVVTTAPTMRQVENLLWRELRAAHENAIGTLGGEPLKTRLDLSADWYAIGASSADPDKLQGFHAASGYILIVVDEAAGVAEPAFEAIEGMMTSEHARMLMIGNPTSDSGSFRQSFHSWEHANKIHISVFDSPNFKNNGIRNLDDLIALTPKDLENVEIVNPWLVAPRWAWEKISAWGIDSPMFQARVLGNFPSQSANTVIPLNFIEIAATDEHREKIAARGGKRNLGVDPARFGNDEFVLTPMDGGFVDKQYVYPLTSIPEMVGLIKQFDNPHRDFIGIDVDGLGGGVFDMLYEQKYDNIVEIYNNGKALPDDTGLTFANLVSQLWWLARTLFEKGELAIPNDEKLIMQLSTRRYSFTSRGLTVETKEEWKKRHGGKSSDRADSFIYALADILGNKRRVEAAAGVNVSDKINQYLRE